MNMWSPSWTTQERLDAYIARGLLPPQTEAREWLAPGNEGSPSPPDGYVVSFMAYHTHGFSMPAHHFLREVLHHYKVGLHELAPNSMQHLAAFVALCEGYMGIEPHFKLYTFFFKAVVIRLRSRGPAPWGWCSIQLKSGRLEEQLRLKVAGSNKDWNRYWFYIANEGASRLPEFANRLPPNADPVDWTWGPACGEQRLFADHLACLARLARRGLTGQGVIIAYYRRRVAPLMARPLPLFRMTAEADADVLAACLVSPATPAEDDMGVRLSEVLDRGEFDGNLPRGLPPMLPEPGAVDLVRSLHVFFRLRSRTLCTLHELPVFP